MVRAPADVVYRALWQADFGGPIARVLLAIRLIPALLTDWQAARARLARYRRGEERLNLQAFLAAGFASLDEAPNQELVLGLTGRFWTAGGSLIATHPETFRNGPPPGQAQAAWNFLCTPAPDGGTELSTETRVRIDSGPARSRFRAYWFVVRPFSGLLRRAMLRAVRREAERSRGAAAS